MLQLDNIAKKYNTNTVLQIPSFHLDNGIHWIEGANGSGKTTLLKMIAGLLPFEGDILLNNISQKAKPLLYRKQIGWSEAEPLFPSFLRGSDLIKLYRNIRKSPQSEANVFLSLFDMDDYIDDAIGTYSAGMTKKLSLLLSFLGKPPLIILDEPLITLDAATVVALSHWITEMHQQNGNCFLISSHQDIDRQVLAFNNQFIIQNKTITAV